MRLRPTLLLLLLLAAPMASAATNPNGHDVITESGILAATMSSDNGRILYGIKDLGSNTPNPPTLPGDPSPPGAAEATWFLVDPGTSNEIETGDVDPAACREPSQGLPADNCSTDTLKVASNALGTRLVATGRAEENKNVLLFQPVSGTPTRFEFTANGPIKYLDLAEDGSAVAIAYQGSPIKWHVRYFGWNSDGSITPWANAKELSAEPVGLDLSEDGKVFVAIANEEFIRFFADSTDPAVVDDSFVGKGASVAVASNVAHTSVTGTTNGRLTIHVDSTTADDQKLNIRRQDSSITAVAITDDGKYIAWSNQAGTFGMGKYDVTSNVFQVLGETNIGAPAKQITLNGTGEVAAVLAGDNLHLFGRHDNQVYPLWKSEQKDNLGTVALRSDGQQVLVPHPGRIVLFDAIYAVNITGDHPTMVPGETAELTLKVRNDGNRLLTTPLISKPLPGWTAVPASANVVVAPNQTLEVKVAVTPSATASPGGYQLVFETLDPEGVATTHRADVSLATVVGWEMDVKQGKPLTLSVNAGEPGTFELAVINKGNTEVKAPVKLSVSDGAWKAEFTKGTGKIMPGATADLDVTVTPPADALELDEATITVRMDGFDDPIQLRAVVGAVFGVTLEIPSGITIIDGESKTFNVTVTNSGNTADGADVTFGELPPGWTGTFDFGLTTAAVKDIPAQSSRTIKATINIPLGEELGAPFLVLMHAVGYGDPLDPSEDTMLVTVEERVIVPPETEESPGIPSVVLLVALGAAAWVARRRVRLV